MTGKATLIGIAVAAALIASNTKQVSAQVAPPPPRAASSNPATPPTLLTLPAPATPPTPPKVVVPASAMPPKDSAVALCNNGTFVMLPGTVADCASRGGLRVAMPPRRKAPAREAALSLSVRPAIVEQGPPTGATMRCRDGIYLSGTASADRCANNGGLAAILPAKPPAPNAPATPAVRRP